MLSEQSVIHLVLLKATICTIGHLGILMQFLLLGALRGATNKHCGRPQGKPLRFHRNTEKNKQNKKASRKDNEDRVI